MSIVGLSNRIQESGVRIQNQRRQEAGGRRQRAGGRRETSPIKGRGMKPDEYVLVLRISQRMFLIFCPQGEPLRSWLVAKMSKWRARFVPFSSSCLLPPASFLLLW